MTAAAPEIAAPETTIAEIFVAGADFDLRRDAVEPARPVVLRGLVADWTATLAGQVGDVALDAYLRGLAAPLQAEMFVGEAAIAGHYFYGEGPEGFNFRRVPARPAEALDAIAQRRDDPALGTAYLGSLVTTDAFPAFAQENPAPGLPAGTDPRIWIGNASHVAAHYDTYDNLACVVAGRRRFTLFPPDAIGDLYVGPIDNTLAGQPVSMAADASDADSRYPRFARARARAVVVDLLPGDALYLPKLWWHQVEATAPFNVMVNYWWDAFAQGPDAPMLTMLLAMIAIAERPEAERQAFRAFFDHYVFRPDGHPLAHMPEAARGILGRLDRAAYGRIRAMVMRGLRG